jgi:hypothetical protein
MKERCAARLFLEESLEDIFLKKMGKKKDLNTVK